MVSLSCVYSFMMYIKFELWPVVLADRRISKQHRRLSSTSMSILIIKYSTDDVLKATANLRTYWRLY